MISEQEKYAHMMLKRLRLEYEKAAKPYVDILKKAREYETERIIFSPADLASVSNLLNSQTMEKPE